MTETFLYLTTTGWKSRTPHTIEIWYVLHDSTYYLCAERREDAHWVQNIRHNPEVQFYVAEHGTEMNPRPGTAHVLDDDPALAHTVRAAFDAKYNWSNGLLVAIVPQQTPLEDR